MRRTRAQSIGVGLAISLLAVSCGTSAQRPGSARNPEIGPLLYDIERDSDVPELPFDDNPDPSQCGIPVQWGESDNEAWLTGFWEGEMLEPEVFLYESHLRTSIVGTVPHGTMVEVVLYQQNPVLDYYFVRVDGDGGEEGWVPAPFLSFQPVG